MNLTGRPIYAKGKTEAKTKRKPMKRVSAKKRGGMFVSTDLRQFAKGRECQMKSEWCNHDPSTVVLCHSRRLAGCSNNQKPHDFWAYHGCSGCHANEDKIEFKELYLAILRTQWAVYEHFGTMTP